MNDVQIFNDQEMFDFQFEDFDSFFNLIPNNPFKSVSLWNLLLNMAKKHGFSEKNNYQKMALYL